MKRFSRRSSLRSALSITTVAVLAAAGGAFLMTQTAGARGNFQAPAPVTIASVDLAKLINGLQELKVRNEAQAARGKEMQSKLDDMKRQILAIEEQLKPEGGIPKTDVRARMTKFSEKLELESLMKARREAYMQMVDFDTGDLIRDLYAKVQVAVDELAKREGYDIVILDDRSISIPNPAGMDSVNEVIGKKRLLYARPGIDVTDKVMQAMNAAYEVGGAAGKP